MADADLRNTINRLADEMIAGLKREGNRPFSGLAYGPQEAVDRYRHQVLAAITVSERHGVD